VLAAIVAPLVVGNLSDTGGGFAGQLHERWQLLLAQLHPSYLVAEIPNAAKFWGDTLLFMALASGDTRPTLLPALFVTIPSLLYCLFASGAYLWRGRGALVPAACGLLLFTFMLVSALLYIGTPKGNYGPLYAVFGIATAVTRSRCVALARCPPSLPPGTCSPGRRRRHDGGARVEPRRTRHTDEVHDHVDQRICRARARVLSRGSRRAGGAAVHHDVQPHRRARGRHRRTSPHREGAELLRELPAVEESRRANRRGARRRTPVHRTPLRALARRFSAAHPFRASPQSRAGRKTRWPRNTKTSSRLQLRQRGESSNRKPRSRVRGPDRCCAWRALRLRRPRQRER
jgi:hypothetical protein